MTMVVPTRSGIVPSSYLDVGQLSRDFSMFEVESDRQFARAIVTRVCWKIETVQGRWRNSGKSLKSKEWGNKERPALAL
jgi:hypothetical protein